MFNRFSTNGSPVNIRFPQGFELPPQYFILRTLCTGIMLYNILAIDFWTYCSNCPSRAISAIFKSKGDTTLLRPFQVTGTAQLQISFRYFKAVICAYHYLQSLTSIFGQFIICHQNTIRLVGATPYPTAQLMQLRNPKRSAFSIIITEAFGTFTPTSITVVATIICALPEMKSCICSSFSAAFILPCTLHTVHSGNSSRIC